VGRDAFCAAGFLLFLSEFSPRFRIEGKRAGLPNPNKTGANRCQPVPTGDVGTKHRFVTGDVGTKHRFAMVAQLIHTVNHHSNEACVGADPSSDNPFHGNGSAF